MSFSELLAVVNVNSPRLVDFVPRRHRRHFALLSFPNQLNTIEKSAGICPVCGTHNSSIVDVNFLSACDGRDALSQGDGAPRLCSSDVALRIASRLSVIPNILKLNAKSHSAPTAAEANSISLKSGQVSPLCGHAGQLVPIAPF